MRRAVTIFSLAALGAALMAGTARAEVLFDQTTGIEITDAVYSDDFTQPQVPGLPDSQVADDFTVPSGQVWTVNEVDLLGDFINTAELDPFIPRKLNVWIYTDAGGFPGAQVFFQAAAQALPGAGMNPDFDADYKIPLSGVPQLQAGHYWVSVQQTEAYAESGEGLFESDWLWSLHLGVTGSPPVVMTADGTCVPGSWTPIDCAGPVTMSVGTRASTRAASGSDTLFNILGGRSAAPASGSAGTACATIKPEAGNFHPRVPKTPVVLGVRAKIGASAPAQLDIDAKVKLANGSVTDLGHFSRKVSRGVNKLRIPLPAKLRSTLQRLDRVTLLLHVVTKPLGSSTCVGNTKDIRLPSRVINVRRNLLHK